MRGLTLHPSRAPWSGLHLRLPLAAARKTNRRGHCTGEIRPEAAAVQVRDGGLAGAQWGWTGGEDVPKEAGLADGWGVRVGRRRHAGKLESRIGLGRGMGLVGRERYRVPC